MYAMCKISHADEPPDLRACRVCLETNCKLYTLRDESLKYIYSSFTSSIIEVLDGLPHYICIYCKALLLKSVAFRNKCLATVKYLQTHLINEPVSLDFLHSLDKTAFEHSYKISPTISIDLSENDLDNTESKIKQELKTENYTDDVIYLGDHDVDTDNKNVDLHDSLTWEYGIFSNNIVEKTKDFEDLGGDVEFNTESDNETSYIDIDANIIDDNSVRFDNDLRLSTDINKDSVRTNCKTEGVENKVSKSKKIEVNNDKLKEIVSDKLKGNRGNRTFYTFILKKYVEKSIEFKEDVMEIVENKDIVKIDDKFHFAISDIVKDIDVEDSAEIPRKMFYAYIKKVYKQKNKPSRYPLPATSVDIEENCKKRLGDVAKNCNFTLKELSFEEQRQEIIEYTAKFKNCIFKCDLCLRGFQIESRFKRHMQRMHDPSQGEVSCEVCGRRCRNARRLVTHLMRHKYQLVCNTCGQLYHYSNTYEAKLHYKSHEGHMFPCEFCGKNFTKYKSRLSHVQIYHSSVQCELCYKMFMNKKAIALHQKLLHSTTFPCGVCKTVFATEEALRTHTSTATEHCSKLVPCANCGYNFISESKQKDHITTCHPFTWTTRYEACCSCECLNKTKNMISKSDYTDDINPSNINPDDRNPNLIKNIGDHLFVTNSMNMDKINESNNDSIEICDAETLSISNRSKSRRVRKMKCNCDCENRGRKKPKKKLMCETCGKTTFQSTTHLRMHQLVHSGERPYTCDLCGKTFRTKLYIQMHMATHTGERNFPCPLCEKKFKTCSALFRHKNSVHLKLRPHQCTLCGSKQQTSTALKMHIHTVHLKNPYPRRNRPRRKKHTQD